jgi:hypothetical protein
LFGYVRPFKPELKINEFDTYKGIYCGLCKQLGREYGQLSRMALSYDFAFLAMLSLAVHETGGRFERQVCVAHPLKKKPCLCCCDDLSFVAACAMAMLYYKWKDNLADSGFWKRSFYRITGFPAKRAYRKAVANYPVLKEIMKVTIAKQQETEKTLNCTIDMAAEASSRALALIFEQLTDDEKQKKVLHRFGFLLGRWIYLIDALDDLKDDCKSGSFNPLLIWAKEAAAGADNPEEVTKRYAEGLINVTHGEMALAFELIEINRYKTILDNILYLGLPSVKKQVLSHGRNKQNDGSL